MILQHDSALRDEKLGRLEEIANLLTAYRCGWIPTDPQRETELKRERERILDSLPRVHG